MSIDVKVPPLAGPKRLFITGELAHADKANLAKATIEQALGSHSDRSVFLDTDLFLSGLHFANKEAKRDVSRNHVRHMIGRIPPFSESLLIVGGRHTRVSEAVGFLIGHALDNKDIEDVFYMGPKKNLGGLAVLAGSGITVVTNPLEVYQWASDEELAAEVTG